MASRQPVRIPYLPTNQLPSRLNFLPQIGNFGIGAVNSLVGPFGDLGSDLLAMAQKDHQGAAQVPYDELLSPVSRLVYQGAQQTTPDKTAGLNVHSTPSQTIGDIAGVGEIPLNWALLGKARALSGANQVAKNYAYKIAPEAVNGAKFGYLMSFLQKLQEKRNEHPMSQLMYSAGEAAPYALVGGAAGAGAQALRSVLSNASRNMAYENQFTQEPSQSAGRIRLRKN